MTARKLDLEVWELDNAAVGPFGQQQNGVRIIVHAPSTCAGNACTLHDPSNHAQRDWPMNYRSDRGLMERICPHGIGHPDPDDLAFHVRQGRDWQSVHGCDGCCSEPTPFPQ